jgi:formate hydrogenlyase transcriptional activator
MASGEHGSHQPVRSTDTQPDGTLAKDLASEEILEILRMILAGASLKEVLTSVVRVVESHREGMLCSVWLLDQDRVHMQAIAAPTLPESYVAALDGFVVGPQGGSCGAAVNQRRPVFVSDVLTDPILEQVRDIIAAYGICACWSAPIISHQGEILGTFAFYFRSVRSPSPRDIHLIENATSIAGIAIERKKAEENLRRSEWSLLEAQRLGHSGSWSLDVSSGIVTIRRKCSGHLTSNRVTTVQALTFGLTGFILRIGSGFGISLRDASLRKPITKRTTAFFFPMESSNTNILSEVPQ